MRAEKTILFVDDEAFILNALRRTLKKESWRLLFAGNGTEGLALMEREGVDLVVSDLRMPGMDGVAFLRRVQRKHPETLRIALSGYAEQELVKQAFSEAGVLRLLSKPWDEEVLKGVLRQALEEADQQRQAARGLLKVLNNLESLPALPRICADLRQVLEEDEKLSVDQIAGLIQQDPSISMRLMKWANSALFGQSAPVDTVKRAVMVLGLGLVSGLVTSMKVFDVLRPSRRRIGGLDREAFWRHCAECACLARLLGQRVFASREDLDRAFTAGLLHDMGKLVADLFLRQKFAQTLKRARARGEPLHQAEQEKMGTTHMEIGAHLAHWWNLPDYVASATRWHHHPEASATHRELVRVVHLADACAHRLGAGASGQPIPPAIDETSRAFCGLSAAELDDLRACLTAEGEYSS